MSKGGYINLSVCGYCGEEPMVPNKKMICSGYANVLCRSCISLFDDEVEIIAKKYLCATPKPQENKC